MSDGSAFERSARRIIQRNLDIEAEKFLPVLKLRPNVLRVAALVQVRED